MLHESDNLSFVSNNSTQHQHGSPPISDNEQNMHPNMEICYFSNSKTPVLPKAKVGLGIESRRRVTLTNVNDNLGLNNE